MSRFVLTVFRGEAQAREGFDALAQLHRKRGTGVRGAVAVRRAGDAPPAILDRREGAPSGAGTLGGALRKELLDTVGRELLPGSIAVLAELSEDPAVQVPLAPLGGEVVCEWLEDWWEDFVEDLARRERAPAAPLDRRHP